MRNATGACFVELGPPLPLARRAAIEAAGSFFLMFVIVGASALAQRQSPDALLVKLVVATGISGALIGLIIAFGPLSGGHLNPLISVVQWFPGKQRPLSCAALYVIAQIGGACAGAWCAKSILGAGDMHQPALSLSGNRAGSEAICSIGLMAIVLAASNRGQRSTAPFAVGGWLAAASFATPSAPYANPAVTLAAIVADGPVHLPAHTALVYVGIQFAAALVAFSVTNATDPELTAKVEGDGAHQRGLAPTLEIRRATRVLHRIGRRQSGFNKEELQ
jgi:glycerol uptake facilitator-like aquaporin